MHLSTHTSITNTVLHAVQQNNTIIHPFICLLDVCLIMYAYININNYKIQDNMSGDKKTSRQGNILSIFIYFFIYILYSCRRSSSTAKEHGILFRTAFQSYARLT